MGSKYEVSEWWRNKTNGGSYQYHSELKTEWLIVALWKVWQLKRTGAACVKLEFRN